MENRTPTQKRTVAITEKKTGLSSVSNLILIGVLLAAGAVLKLFLSSYFTVMKPNFVIAMYCLAILLIKPKVYEGAIIGILAGAICQFFPGTPAFVGVMYAAFYMGASIVPTPLAAFMGIIFGTAAINAVIVQILVLPIKAALRKD